MKDVFDFLVEPTFSFADLTRLTGVHPTNIHAFIRRGRFEPQLELRVGAGGSKEAKTYTGIDVLRLHLIAHLVHYRLADTTFLAQKVREIDRRIMDFMKSEGRWRKPAPYPKDKRAVPKDSSKKLPFTVFVWSPKGPSIRNSRNPWKEFRPGGEWCYLVLDLHTLVETQCIRMAEYSRLVSTGVDRDKALGDVDKRLAKHPRTLWLGYLRAREERPGGTQVRPRRW